MDNATIKPTSAKYRSIRKINVTYEVIKDEDRKDLCPGMTVFYGEHILNIGRIISVDEHLVAILFLGRQRQWLISKSIAETLPQLVLTDINPTHEENR